MIPTTTCLGIQARVFSVRCSHFVRLKREMKREKEKKDTNEIETYNFFFRFFFRK